MNRLAATGALRARHNPVGGIGEKDGRDHDRIEAVASSGNGGGGEAPRSLIPQRDYLLAAECAEKRGPRGHR